MPESRDEIIARFRVLSLPVTDDSAKIKGAYDSQHEYHHRMSIVDPDEAVRLEHRTWFRVVQPLLNCEKLQEYVATLQALFWDLAEPLQRGGATTDHLVKVAREQFGFDDDLARRTVTEKKRPEPAQPVSGLRAKARPKFVLLSWHRPRDKCDSITLQRLEAGKKGPPTILFQQVLRDDFKDDKVDPGKHYIYQIYSVFQGLSNMDPVSVEVIVPEELRNVRATWRAQEGRPSVEVTWEWPAQCAGVALFRRIGAAPLVQDDLAPGDAATTLCLETTDRKCTNWTDQHAAEGKDHHYLVVARYEGEARSDGVTRVVSVPRAPGPVSRAQVTYDGKTNTARLTWDRLPESGPVEYVVVRSDGDTPPLSPSRGKVIAETKATECLDEELEPGQSYVYSVFSRREGLQSGQGTPAGSIVALADVTEVKVDPRDNLVILVARPRPNVSEVQVLCAQHPHVPTDPADKQVRLVQTAGDRAEDRGVGNDIAYNYMVRCLYRLPDGTVRASAGLVVEKVTPKAPPPPVTGAVAERQNDGRVQVRYPPVDDAQVRVYRLAKPPQWRCGEVVTVDDIESQGWGEPIRSEGPTVAVDADPRADRLYYLPVTVQGSQATIGQIRRLPIPEVKGLRALVVDGGVRLRWEWPETCEAVRVVRREGAWPESPNDPAGKIWEVNRETYDQDGESTVDRQAPQGQDLYYAVYGKLGTEFAFCDAQQSGCQVRVTQHPALEYHLQLLRRKVIMRWRLDPVPPTFGGFIMAWDDEHPPVSHHGSGELVKWLPGANGDSDLSGWKEVAIPAPEGAKRLYYRLFLLDRDDYARIRVSHPDNGGPLAPARKLQLPWRRHDGVKHRHRPKDIVCPHCFQVFPVWKMRFRYIPQDRDPDAGKTYPLPGAWWARVCPFYRLAGAFPQGPHGRFEEKICAFDDCLKRNQRPLPLTAGVQRSLVIGLVGGRQVGKSHYVVSLIKRLRRLEQRFALRSLDDTTHDRFLPMEKRLFENRDALAPTQVTEDALIYSLTPTGVGGHSCTLALYDTAGEFFGTNKDIAERTPYLREADGLILLVDPSQCASLAKQLGGRLQGTPMTVVLDNVVSRLRTDLRLLDEAQKIPTPLAVAFTKADVLRDAGLIDQRSLWHLPVFHEGSYNLHLHHEEDSLFGDMVSRYGDGIFNTIVAHFQHYAFFGISATGCSAVDGRFPRIAPLRVEEPLLWLLYRLGVIGVR